MNPQLAQVYGDATVFLVAVVFLLVVAFMVAILIIGWLFTSRKDSVSPYTGMPLRRGRDLSYNSMLQIYKFMEPYKEYDNRMFKVTQSAIDRETGRVFPNCITWTGHIKLDWTFLQKRLRGNYVSWGSLTKERQDEIRRLHDTLDGYQTEFSCPRAAPVDIESAYIYTKPGPLYVDPDTAILIGWKMVPGTELEVLIVQRPIKRYY
jgi:hypothetical protein